MAPNTTNPTNNTTSNRRWDEAQIPDQTGRVVIVTGANSGIGFETARCLADKGAHVILACRSQQRGQDAVDRIQANNPAGKAELMSLDLSSLESVKAFAEAFHVRFERLDLLINNAGVMMPPKSQTAEGFELQIGTNHFGHYALTGQLLPLLEATEGSRVVTVASNMHKAGKLDLDDLHYERRAYRKMAAYGQSKLANLLFTYELSRRLQTSSSKVLAVAAHPGWTHSNLTQHMFKIADWAGSVMAQTPLQGAWPTLMAAVVEDAQSAQYFGPSGLGEMKGHPRVVASNSRSHDTGVAARLWDVSEEATGVVFPFALRAALKKAS